MNQDRFDCGWNDTAHGINTWTDHEQWPSALAWAIHVRDVARTCSPTDYHRGVIAAVDHYQENGEINSRVRRSLVEV